MGKPQPRRQAAVRIARLKSSVSVGGTPHWSLPEWLASTTPQLRARVVALPQERKTGARTLPVRDGAALISLVHRTTSPEFPPLPRRLNRDTQTARSPHNRFCSARSLPRRWAYWLAAVRCKTGYALARSELPRRDSEDERSHAGARRTRLLGSGEVEGIRRETGIRVRLPWSPSGRTCLRDNPAGSLAFLACLL